MSADTTDLPGGLEELAGRLARGTGPCVLVAPDLQAHPEALADLTEDPRATTAALVARHASADAEGDAKADAAAGPDAVSGDVRPGAHSGLRLRAGRIAAASSSVHRVGTVDAQFVGALRVAAADRPAAADAARHAAAVARSARWQGDPLDHLLVAMVRARVPVAALRVDPWPWRRGPAGSAATAFAARLAALSARQVQRLRLLRARKIEDGAWASLVSRPLSHLVTPLALRAGLTPDAVTVSSFVVGLAAAGGFATGERAGLVAGALLLQLSLVLDCVDGDLARYRRAFTAAGAWLDASTDRVKEFACYGGLAMGAMSGGARTDGDVWSVDGQLPWLLAALMLTLQTVRHTVDYTFTAVKELREAAAAHVVPLEVVEDDGAAAPLPRAVQASARGNRRNAVKWTKRVLHLGIGERWAVISLFAVSGRPVLALAVLLALGLLSLGYTSAGRILRTRGWVRQEPSGRERGIVAAQADGGPLAPGLARRLAAGGSGFLWVRPAVLRLLEYLVALALVLRAAPEALPVAFGLLLVVASHHYDDLYRVLNGLPVSARASRLLGLGAPGRIAALLVLTLLGALTGRPQEVATGGLLVLAVVLGILFLVVEPVRVLRVTRSVLPATDEAGQGDG